RRPAARAEEGALAPAAARAPVHDAVDPRLRGLLRLPARDERVPVVHALRPPLPAALDRARELPLPVHDRPADLAGGEEHALDDRRRGPAAGAVAFGIATMLARAKAGAGFFRTI